MFIGLLTFISVVLLPHSTCRMKTMNTPSNGTFRATDMPNAHRLAR